MCETTDLLQELKLRKFWGKLIVELRNGAVVLLRKEETIRCAPKKPK